MIRTKFEFNSKKGFSGIDIAVAIVVIAIGLSLIVAMSMQINKMTSQVNREIQAAQIVREVFEKIKVMTEREFRFVLAEVSNENYETQFEIDIPNGYLLEITTEEKMPTTVEEAIRYSLRTEGEIIVSYSLGSETKQFKVPYFRYPNRVPMINKANINGKITPSVMVASGAKLKPVVGTETNYNIVTDYNEWNAQGIREQYNSRKAAIIKDTNDNDVYLVWAPRAITGGSKPIFLVGNSMYSLEPHSKTITFGANTIKLVVGALVEQTGTVFPAGDAVDGMWEKPENLYPGI